MKRGKDKREMQGKKGQIMGLSFQMIFAIILIAVFIYVAIFAIRTVMQNVDRAKIALFVSDLKGKVNEVFYMTESSQEFKFDLPSGIKYVCFTSNPAKMNIEKWPDFYLYKTAKSNLLFYPPESVSNLDINPNFLINCEGTDCLQLPAENPYCIANENGIKITLSKSLGSRFVSLK